MGQCLGSLSIQCSGRVPVEGAPPPPPHRMHFLDPVSLSPFYKHFLPLEVCAGVGEWWLR